jgi:hypothetical protein
MSEKNKTKKSAPSAEDTTPKKMKIHLDYAESGGESNELLAKADKMVDAKQAAMDYFNIVNNNKSKQGLDDKKAPPRLALTYDPNLTESHQGVKAKTKGLLPDTLIKEISSTNHLIASILRGWSNAVSMWGQFQKNRFDVGMKVSIKDDFEREMTPEQIEKVKDRMERFKTLLLNCGYTEGLSETKKMGLSQFLYMQTTNALKFGRIGTEIVRTGEGEQDDEKSKTTGRYNRHRPVDIGTIYRTFAKASMSEVKGLRNQLAQKLDRESDEKIKAEDLPEVDPSDIYPWVQLVNGFKDNYFSDKELLVYTFYPSTDVEHNGYPLTPIDTCITSITTHLSIEAYTKLFFLNGRGSKGILVVKSDEVEQNVLEDFKQQFNATINNVNNSFRTPIFGINKDDEITWEAIDAPSKDGEFQFLYDQVSRNILSSFGMSPDELPGYGHLSRGTNSQSMSESNNEYKLTAARDMGLRPLIRKMQAFFNESLFPAMDPELSQLCIIEFAGLDAESRQQENERLATEQPIHMTYDETMKETEKEQLGDYLGGGVPLNDRVQAIIDKYVNTGNAISDLLKNPAALVDPTLQYRRDGFYLQHLAMMAELEPYAVKAKYAPNPIKLELMKQAIQDYLDEDEIQEEEVEGKVQELTDEIDED